MGYRSDATLLMKKVDYEKMKLDCSPNGKYPSETVMEYIDYIDDITNFKDMDGREYIKLDWYSIKWYEDAVQDYLMGCPDHVYYEFIRIGEDYDDVECRSNVPEDEFYRMYVRREVEMDYSELMEA